MELVIIYPFLITDDADPIILKMKIGNRLICIFCSGLLFSSQTLALTYKVARGDTLSQIAQRFFDGKIYGSSGSLAKIMELNPNIINADLIFVDQIIEVQVRERSIAATEEVEVVAEKEPAPTNKIAKVKIHSLYTSFYFGSAGIMQTDDVSGVEETAYSDLGLGLSLIWSHHWSKNFDVFSVGSLKSFTFNVDESRELESSSMTQSFVGVGAKYKFSRFSISPTLGMGESILLSSDGTTIDIDKVTLSNVSVTANTNLYTSDNGFNLDLMLRYGHIIPATKGDFTIESGSYTSIGLSSRREILGRVLSLGVQYTDREIKLEESTQESLDLGVTVGTGWAF